MANENECQQVNTLEGNAYVRVLTNDGVTAKISIEDLVAIVTAKVVKIDHHQTVIDCNAFKETRIITGYRWVNAPVYGISILEVFRYSGDWVIQRFTVVESPTITWVRSFYNGTSWGEWKMVQLM